MPAAIPPRLLVFLKAPHAGAVKTRLAATLGPTRALRIYRWLVARQLAAVPAGWVTETHYTPRGAGAEMRAWLGNAREYRAQDGSDLGTRLTRAFAGAFQRGAQRVIAIGGDCPTLDPACLRRAARTLRRTDVVLGPARDGGYYLIGLRAPAPELFFDIPWGGPDVLVVTLQRSLDTGRKFLLLDEKEDIDDLPSLERCSDRIAELRALWQPASRED